MDAFAKPENAMPSYGAHALELPATHPEGGLNRSLYILALKAANRGIPPQETAEILLTWNRGQFAAGAHHRRATRTEVFSQVRGAYAKVGSTPSAPFSFPPPPVAAPDRARQLSRIAEAAGSGWGVEELRAHSEYAPPTLRACLSALFAPPELVCLGTEKTQFETRTWGEWSTHPLSGVRYVLPNPMRAPSGRTLSGRESARCNDNASAHPRWGVLEFDCPEADLNTQAALLRLFSLHRGWPLGLVLFSGGKSLHGWFAIEGRREAFTRDVVWVGGDSSCRVRAQAYRAPRGVRENGVRQEVLFWNWETVDAALRWSFVEGGVK